MSSASLGIPVHQLPKPQLSLTTVRWLTEIPDPEDSDSVEDVEMFTVVGEQYRLDVVEAAAVRLGEFSDFVPPRFWLVHDDGNKHDDLAVAVYAISVDEAFHVGFLPKDQARAFRSGMQAINREGQSLEVLGCLTQGKTAPHPNGRIYLPVQFAELCQSGYVDDPSNQVPWLKDSSPVLPRPSKGRLKDEFSFEELCKIFCWCARKRRWFCFPDDCESNAEGLLAVGSGLPRADFAPFLLPESQGSPVSSPLATPATSSQSLPVENQWFYRHAGVESGPFSADELRAEAVAERLVSSDHVRRGDLAKWVPASRVKGLFMSGAVAAASSAAEAPQASDAFSVEAILSAAHDLPQPWTVGELSTTLPKMFESLPTAEQQASRRLLRDGKPNGHVAILLFSGIELAKQVYRVVSQDLGKGYGMVARLGDEARFMHMVKEMPPITKLPPVEFVDLVFRRQNIVLHMRMMDMQPEPAVSFAVDIDTRLAATP